MGSVLTGKKNSSRKKKTPKAVFLKLQLELTIPVKLDNMIKMFYTYEGLTDVRHPKYVLLSKRRWSGKATSA